MADTLRPRQVPKPPVTGPGYIPANQLPGDGKPPLRTGAVVMSDFTRRNLQAVGWKDGDPIPGDMGQRLQQIQQEVAKERADATLEGSELAKDWKPVVPSFVDITELPPERQAEIQQYLQDYKQHVEEQQRLESQQTAADAAIPESVTGPTRDLMRDQILAGENAMARRRAQQEVQQLESVVIDDRQQPVTAAPPASFKVPEGKTFGGYMGIPPIAEKIEKMQAQQVNQPPAASPPVQQPDEPVSTLPPVPTGHCQRCDWPLSIPFEIKPTPEDKQAFLAAILGLARFEKKYSLLNGNLVVYYRSLSVPEVSALQQQLGHQVRNGEILGDGEFLTAMSEYRLAMSVSRIVIGGTVTYSADPLFAWEAKNPPTQNEQITATAVPRMVRYFNQQGVQHEPVRRMIAKQHQEFQRLVEMMEAMTNDPDFWKGIELRA